MGGKVDLAGQILEDILSLERADAQKAAKHYHDRYHQDQGIQVEAMQIPFKLKEGDNNGALEMIYRCFGLQGPPAICALESMRGMIWASFSWSSLCSNDTFCVFCNILACSGIRDDLLQQEHYHQTHLNQQPLKTYEPEQIP